MENTPFIDCQNLIFSPRLSENRTDQSQQTLGSIVVQRILCFALYLLGLNRKAIGQSLSIPSETAKSIIKAVNRDGLAALEDRRRRFSTRNHYRSHCEKRRSILWLTSVSAANISSSLDMTLCS
ncbi:MAG: hypothetical protein JRE64_26980 [Deltaproteobacteria bacterium]|nr:hypothetical protein [Deltaproteobacteria bacterium]